MTGEEGIHMKTLKLVLMLAVIVGAGWRILLAKKLASNDLSNMIIEGENRLEVHATLPPVDWKPDLYKDVNTELYDNYILKGITPPQLTPVNTNPADKLATNKTATPWLDHIYSAPVIRLTIKSKGPTKNSEYVFLVKNSEGKNFYTMKKKGTLPSEIDWNGVGDSGEPLQVGFDYTYLFSSVDEAGNPQRTAGKPFQLPAFRYKKGREFVNSFNPEALFADRSAIKFSQDGVNYLTEIKDRLRPDYGRPVDIVVYEDDANFAIARANKIKDFLVQALTWPEDKITNITLALNRGGGYRHVDIIEK